MTTQQLSFHASLALGSNVVGFNAPPELLKRLMAAKVQPPNVLVLGDTAIHRDTALANIEFLVLYQLFVGKGYDFAAKKMVKPIYLVGEKRRVDAHLKALRLALTGLTSAEFKACGVNKNIRMMLEREAKYFALNMTRDGAFVPIEEICRPVYFEKFSKSSGRAVIEELGITIDHQDRDEYEVAANGEKHTVKLTPEGVLAPSWPLPELRAVHIPNQFRMFVLGSDSGFGPGPTTGLLFEVEGEYYMWDCPAYVAQLLLHNGIMPGQVRSIVISHIHDDHANDLLPFALNSMRKVEIIATREVMYALKAKLSALWNMSVKRIEQYFRWKVISVGNEATFDLFGYQAKPFYGLHPIPSIGAEFFHNGHHVLTLSGDTGLRSVAEKMEKDGYISKERQAFIENLPKKGMSFVDVGEATIHGTPADLAGYDESKLYIYHRATLPPEFEGRINFVKPGEAYASVAGNLSAFDTSTLSAVLRRLGIRETEAWTKVFMSEGEVQTHERNKVVLQKGSGEVDFVYFIVHGIVDVKIDDSIVATLSKGDFFGEQAILSSSQVRARNATIFSRSTLRVIAIPGKRFKAMIAEDHRLAEEANLGNESAYSRLQQVWKNRAVVAGVREFERLSSSLRNDLSVRVTTREFAPGQVIVDQHSALDEVYIVAKGSVEVFKVGQNAEIPLQILRPYEIFGEMVALGIQERRTATVQACEHCQVLVLKGPDVKAFFDQVPGLRYALEETAISRGQLTGEAA